MDNLQISYYWLTLDGKRPEDLCLGVEHCYMGDKHFKSKEEAIKALNYRVSYFKDMEHYVLQEVYHML